MYIDNTSNFYINPEDEELYREELGKLNDLLSVKSKNWQKIMDSLLEIENKEAYKGISIPTMEEFIENTAKRHDISKDKIYYELNAELVKRRLTFHVDISAKVSSAVLNKMSVLAEPEQYSKLYNKAVSIMAPNKSKLCVKDIELAAKALEEQYKKSTSNLAEDMDLFSVFLVDQKVNSIPEKSKFEKSVELTRAIKAYEKQHKKNIGARQRLSYSDKAMHNLDQDSQPEIAEAVNKNKRNNVVPIDFTRKNQNIRLKLKKSKNKREEKINKKRKAQKSSDRRRRIIRARIKKSKE